MQERTHERGGLNAWGGSGLGSLFPKPGTDPLTVEVASGVQVERLPVANMTVGEIRRRLADRLDIAPGAAAEINGQVVGDDVKIEAGQSLKFIRPAGEKGR